MKLTMLFIYIIFFLINQTIGVVTNDDLQNTLNYINQLQQRIEQNIDLLNNRVQQTSSNLNENIHDLESKSNVPTIISSLQNEIPDSSECAYNANNQISTLLTTSKADVSQCMENAISKTGDFAAQTGVLIHKANNVKSEIIKRVETCVKGNIGNDVGLGLCLVAQVFPLEKPIRDLEKEIEVTFGVGQQTAQDILNGLGQCLTETENITSNKSANILKSYQDCVNFNNLN